MLVHDVFTPGDYPDYTYVEREQGEYEQDLQFRLQGSASIISLSGPSKSGKSMLLNNVVEKLGYNLVTVHGSNIGSAEDLWSKTLDELTAPQSTEQISSEEEEAIKDGKAGVNTPVVNIGAGGTKRNKESTEQAEVYDRRGLSQVIDLVDINKFVLFIDDAHYIDKQLHAEIAESIKDAYERGMSICVAFIPYRSDDLIRANPDLSGRIDAIKLDYWDISDLMSIGEKGFEKLNLHPPELMLQNLARESIGSPHLMQKLCLELCNEINVLNQKDEMSPMTVESSDIKNVLRKTGNGLDYSTIYDIMSGGAAKRGGQRNIFNFGNRQNGDVYDVIARVIASNPPKLTLDQSEITKKVDDICYNNKPQSGNLTQAIQRVDKWISESNGDEHVFEWVDDRKNLEIPDPYLVFYLRWSDKIDLEPHLH
ncbi:AAA domain-containing protein [Natronoarchaeum philippinense]|uniref:AAA domain-containing protein n=1 Tax=Natronoarchaeum philippinense TaxID=558529 RepID=A0A285N8I9_NATPI|nr:AAA family ATPase [Natronoarchaeum philippinense]SNZ05775.1 AAA domain-containing protein [Natronoarchaeum philippinense]